MCLSLSDFQICNTKLVCETDIDLTSDQRSDKKSMVSYLEPNRIAQEPSRRLENPRSGIEQSAHDDGTLIHGQSQQGAEKEPIDIRHVQNDTFSEDSLKRKAQRSRPLPPSSMTLR